MVFQSLLIPSAGAGIVEVAITWAVGLTQSQKAARLYASSSPRMSSHKIGGSVLVVLFCISNCASFRAITAERCWPSEAYSFASRPAT